jgi:hypothetical protein
MRISLRQKPSPRDNQHEMRTLSRATLVVALALTSCGARAPRIVSAVPRNHDVELTVLRAAPPLGSDCDVRLVDAHCRIELTQRPNELKLECAFNLPADEAVADVTMCVWGRDELSVLGPLACRAGGDTIVRSITMTDSCIEHRPEGKVGTGAASYTIYRLRH